MNKYNIAVLGGTGPQGRGLAYRFAKEGHQVIIGSRSADRAKEKVLEILEKGNIEGAITGDNNENAVNNSDVVVLAIPYKGHDELVTQLADSLAGKIVISCVNPLGFDSGGPFALSVEKGSAAEEAQAIQPKAKIVGAFHHVSALNLWNHDGYLSDEDILICGDDEDANLVVSEIAKSVTGNTGIISGSLRLARELEPWTAVLISINKRLKKRSGIKITGIN